MTYPRKPTEQERKKIAEYAFPDTPVNEVDFTDVWMLADFRNDLEFNCFAWSILAINTVIIPPKLENVTYYVQNAKKKEGSPYDYSPTGKGAADAAIIAWGSAKDDIMHTSRICSKSLLEESVGEFKLAFDFSSAAAKDFPKGTFWSSKFGDTHAFITHPRNWLSGGCWGTAQGAYKTKK